MKKKTSRKSKNPVGRPTKLTEPIKEEILRRISMGETLTNICKDEHIPDQANIYRLTRKDDNFRMEYQRAREEQAHTWVDKTIQIAMDRSRDLIEYEDANGPKKLGNSAAVQRDKLICDHFFRVSQALAARYYAPKKEEQSFDIDLPQVIVNIPSHQPELPESLEKKLPH